jgi:hypothetical protein
LPLSIEAINLENFRNLTLEHTAIFVRFVKVVKEMFKNRPITSGKGTFPRIRQVIPIYEYNGGKAQRKNVGENFPFFYGGKCLIKFFCTLK